jgi:hypothetical protein
MVARLVLSGFPWLSPGYAMIDSLLAGWAPLFESTAYRGPRHSVALSVPLTPVLRGRGGS